MTSRTMRADVARDLLASRVDFERLVWPVLSRLIGGGKVVPVESEHATDLDMLAGIDAWQIVDPTGMRGIASRVQPAVLAWDTFTIRFSRERGTETEFDKRLRALSDRERGWLLPHLTLQAYVSKDHASLLSLGVARTADLFNHAAQCVAAQGPDRERQAHGLRGLRRSGGCYLDDVHDGSASFLVVPWAHLQQCSIPLRRWPLATAALEAA